MRAHYRRLKHLEEKINLLENQVDDNSSILAAVRDASRVAVSKLGGRIRRDE
jgi:hypothetical protein